jgi:helicase
LRDFPFLENVLLEVGDSLWQDVPLYGEEETGHFYRSLKTAILLFEWSKETSEAMICERFGVGPGDIYTMVESVNWLVHASVRLARMFNPSLVASISVVEQRVKYGVKPELLSLIALRGIGRIRARRLYNNGITDIETLKTVGKDRIVPILGAGIADQIFTQLDSVESSESPQSSLGEFE